MWLGERRWLMPMTHLAFAESTQTVQQTGAAWSVGDPTVADGAQVAHADGPPGDKYKCEKSTGRGSTCALSRGQRNILPYRIAVWFPDRC
jgi:hypothetical protein